MTSIFEINDSTVVGTMWKSSEIATQINTNCSWQKWK